MDAAHPPTATADARGVEQRELTDREWLRAREDGERVQAEQVLRDAAAYNARHRQKIDHGERSVAHLAMAARYARIGAMVDLCQSACEQADTWEKLCDIRDAEIAKLESEVARLTSAPHPVAEGPGAGAGGCKAQQRLDTARTLVEQVADDCARRNDHDGQVLALAIREILHDDALDAALTAQPPQEPGR